MSRPGRGSEGFYSNGSRRRAGSACGHSSDWLVVRQLGVSIINLVPTSLGSVYVLVGSTQVTSPTCGAFGIKVQGEMPRCCRGVKGRALQRLPGTWPHGTLEIAPLGDPRCAQAVKVNPQTCPLGPASGLGSVFCVKHPSKRRLH